MCVCVCERERERESECECVWTAFSLLKIFATKDRHFASANLILNPVRYSHDSLHIWME